MLDPELLFVWIENYNNIREQGFSLTGRYSINYNKSNGSFVVKANPNFDDNFFIPGSRVDSDGLVSSVTAIVGENGSGKSSFLEYFCSRLRSSTNVFAEPHNPNDVILFYSDGFFIIFNNQKYQTYKVPDEGDFEFDLIECANMPEHEHFSFTHDLIPIYYSTVWSDRTTFLSAQEWELINISNSRFYYTSHFYKIVNDIHRNNSYRVISHPSRHLSEDTKRNIEFITEYNDWLKRIIKFPIVKFITFGVIQQDYSNVRTFISLFDTITTAYLPKDSYSFAKLFISCASIYRYVYITENNNSITTDNSRLLADCLHLENSFEAFREFLLSLPYDKKPKIANDLGIQTKVEDYKIPETIEFLNFLERNFVQGKLDFAGHIKNPLNDYERSRNFNPYRFKLTFDLAGEFLQLYLNHLSINTTPDYLHFETLDYSSGELALINLFSRLPYLKKEIIDEFDRFDRVRFTGTNSVIFLLDECESYFHPNWQKAFLKHFISFVTNIVGGKKIQIIITSHSPIFLSDLPRSNIIFLQKDKETGACMNVTEKVTRETFASSIYSLYANSFFVNDGLLGDFAKNKLIKIAERLTSEAPLTHEERIEIEKTVRIIGEPIWKEKFLEILKNKV